jgi:immunity protein 42 of polymorphic toxin system
MEFGNRKSFAITVDIDQNYGGAWLYGRLCYWIEGIQVGDYELGTSLRDVLFQMKHIVSDCGNRAGEILCTLHPREAFSRLDEELFGTNEGELYDKSQLLEAPARFDITIHVDVFDQSKAYLIECNDNAIIIFKNTSDADIKVAHIAIGAFDSVIKEVYGYLNDLYSRETTNPS